MSYQPWENEPNEAVFEASGLKCKIHRVMRSGHLCGYVGVPASHPWFGKQYSDSVLAPAGALERSIDVDRISVIALFCAAGQDHEEGHHRIELLVDVHGGLTWSDAGDDELEGLWVFGFDCAHAGDLCPEAAKRYSSFDGIYRDFDYVKAESESLARQLASIGATA